MSAAAVTAVLLSSGSSIGIASCAWKPSSTASWYMLCVALAHPLRCSLSDSATCVPLVGARQFGRQTASASSRPAEQHTLLLSLRVPMLPCMASHVQCCVGGVVLRVDVATCAAVTLKRSLSHQRLPTLLRGLLCTQCSYAIRNRPLSINVCYSAVNECALVQSSDAACTPTALRFG